MTATPVVLVATWSDGVVAVTGTDCRQELNGQPVRSLASCAGGSALAVVGRRTIAESDSELSCITAVGDKIYVGTDDDVAFEPDTWRQEH